MRPQRIGANSAFAQDMTKLSLPRVGAIATASLVSLTGCATTGTIGVSQADILAAIIANIPTATTTTAGGGRTTRIPRSPPASAAASRVLRTADSYVGTKYVWGGNTPTQGFDCSGFTKYVFAKYGVTLPRVSRDQVRAGSSVPADFRALRPGDLMFFAESGEEISHVAIYVGNGRIIHASSAIGSVDYTDLNSGGEWFVAYFVAARRVL